EIIEIIMAKFIIKGNEKVEFVKNFLTNENISFDEDDFEVEDIGLTLHQIKDVQTKIMAWLTTHPSVTKKFFAEEVLQRGAGTFSDYMKTTIVPTSEAGKKHWTTMAAFLDDKSTQDALLNKKASCDRGKSFMYFKIHSKIEFSKYGEIGTQWFENTVVAEGFFVLQPTEGNPEWLL
uniref:CUT domain-containing protein n=1 Tax=Clytia hemisphaerica TaxID=252671 RepID=A0A7M5XM98_9CNID